MGWSVFLEVEYKSDIQYAGSESTMAIDTVIKLPENKLISEILGPHQIPQTFSYIFDDEERKLGVHQINPSNMLLLQRHWFCGSCPHLFINKGNKWEYFAETLSKSEKTDAYTYNINTPIDKIKIFEIEDEISYIGYLKISDSNNNILFNLESFKLEKNEFRDFMIPSDAGYPINIKIQGHYIPNGITSNSAEANFYRRQLINQSLKKLNK